MKQLNTKTLLVHLAVITALVVAFLAVTTPANEVIAVYGTVVVVLLAASALILAVTIKRQSDNIKKLKG